jgi:DNA-binding transcriptional regulator YiaG
MNKYPLIGASICAVVLLVLGSLTNVVGYQSVKSTAVNDSPLFRTRTQRATNQQQNLITSQYLGRGKENLLQFQIIDNRGESLKKTVEIISKMDDETFARFTELCIKKARQDKTLRDINPNEITQILSPLRTKSELFAHFLITSNNQQATYCQLLSICWEPGCILAWIWIVIMSIWGKITSILNPNPWC